ncbi:MAG: helix-turn-helix transcriptional regulator [Bacteroidia bacterium]
MHIGKAIKKLRIDRRKSQQNLADYLNISPQAVNGIEKTQDVKQKRVKDIAKFFNVDLNYIIDLAQGLDENTVVNEDVPEYKAKSKFQTPDDIEFLKATIAHKDKMIDVFMADTAYWKQEALRYRGKYEALVPKYEALLEKLEGKK